MTIERMNYTSEDWHALERRLKDLAEFTELKPFYQLSYLFMIADKLLTKEEGTFHYQVGWDWNFQAYTAQITTLTAKYNVDCDTPEHALLLVLELWLEKRGK